jgi:1-phosphofructokinase family hexose kinase
LFVTVTLNPAIDRTISADRLAFEDRGYILSRGESAGGRGLNASQVLHSFGAPTLAIMPSGGSLGARFERMISGFGFPCELIPVSQSVRANLIITDQQGQLNEPGPNLTGEELDRVEEAVRKRIHDARWLLLCGSLPPGTPSNFYQRLIRLGREAGAQVLLDTDADALRDGLPERPAAVTPNLQEASRLLNKALITRAHLKAAAIRILALGAESLVLSLGSRGAIGARGETIFEVSPPRIQAVCPIGAGDALNAAFVWAVTQGMSFVDAVKWGVAAGTASAKLPGLQFANLEQTREVFERVEVR